MTDVADRPATIDPASIDLNDHHSFAGSQPHDAFDWLRQHDPVHRHAERDGGPGYWVLTRHQDVQTVGRDAQTFSSQPTIMVRDPDNERRDPDHVMMLMADPPVHTRMRRMISRRFTPRAARSLAHRVDELASLIVDEVVERGSCDLVTDLAGEMPSFVIADVLGIPLEDGRRLYHHTEMLHSATDVVGIDAQRAAYGEMYAYSQEVYAAKRANPQDDLASLLAFSEVLDDEGGSHPVDEVDFFLWFLLLVDAGGDTTRNLVGGGFDALFNHPSQYAALVANPVGLLESAIEELLRWVSPVVYMRRTATVDTRIGTQPIAAGDKVVMFYGAANRDPEVFADPHRLDLSRTPNPHVAFGGGGPHFCLGAHLARLEINALMGQMLTRLHDLQPTGEAEWMVSNFIFGPSSLPVSFTPGRRSA